MTWSAYARVVVTVWVLGALAVVPVSAQITTGTVAGSVKDEQGLAVPGASVTLFSEARGTRMAPVVTNVTGDFVVPNVTPDTYTVEVAMSGFASTVRPGVAVSGGDRISVGALTLTLGGTSETVTVKSEAPLIQSQSGERSFRVTTAEVENLPIGTGRNFATFTSLTPGVVGATTTARRRRSEQHHDGRRVHHGHRQQRAAAADESRGDCRGEGAGGWLSGRVRALERSADHGRHQERDQSFPRVGVRRHAELRLELEQLGEQDQRDAKSRRQAIRLGLYHRRTGRQARRQQQAVLLLLPRVPAAQRRQYLRQFRVPTLAERNGDFSASLDNNGAPIPALRDAINGGTFPGNRIPAGAALSDRREHSEALSDAEHGPGSGHLLQPGVPVADLQDPQSAAGIPHRLSGVWGVAIHGEIHRPARFQGHHARHASPASTIPTTPTRGCMPLRPRSTTPSIRRRSSRAPTATPIAGLVASSTAITRTGSTPGFRGCRRSSRARTSFRRVRTTGA